MAKKIVIEFNIKIPRGGDHAYSLAVPPDAITATGDALSVEDVTGFILKTAGIKEDGLIQVKVTNGRSVISAWKDAHA